MVYYLNLLFPKGGTMCPELIHRNVLGGVYGDESVIKIIGNVGIPSRSKKKDIVNITIYQERGNTLLLALEGLKGFTEIRSDSHGQVYEEEVLTSRGVASVSINPQATLSVEVFNRDVT